MGGVAYLLFLYFVAPLLVARFLIGADPIQIPIAYAIWFGLLALWGVAMIAGGAKTDEATGWPIIMGMFFTIPAIAVLAILLRVIRALT